MLLELLWLNIRRTLLPKKGKVMLVKLETIICVIAAPNAPHPSIIPVTVEVAFIDDLRAISLP